MLEALGLKLQVPKYIFTEKLSSQKVGQRAILIIVYYEETVNTLVDYSTVPVTLASVDG